MQEILDNPRRLARMERYIQKEFTLDTQDPEKVLILARSLYESEKTVAIERGQGGQIEQLEASDSELLAKYEAAILEKAEIQRHTIQAWLDYLKETPDYPKSRFDEQLSEAVLQRLAELTPRDIRMVLRSAFGTAAAEKRQYLNPNDIRLVGQRGRRVGF